MRLRLLLFVSLAASAQQPAKPGAILTFHFVRAGMPVPDYTLTLHESGAAEYKAVYAVPAASLHSGSGPTGSFAPDSGVTAVNTGSEFVTRPITVSPKTTATLFEHLHNTARLVGGCESHQKNIADTGAKTIRYTGPDGTGECTYNYSENKEVVAITDTFQGIAVTLDEGRSIEQKHRYDRLGLDQELTHLQDAVKDGRAIELGTIAPVLQSLLDDSQVMDRVRKRASALLLAGNPR